MTRQERMKAFEMRLDGKSWTEIGKELGYSSSTVKQDIMGCILASPRQVNCAYPAIRRIITDEYGGSVHAFAIACDVSPNVMYYILPGKSAPKRELIEAILRVTGLSYEEAFQREED